MFFFNLKIGKSEWARSGANGTWGTNLKSIFTMGLTAVCGLVYFSDERRFFAFGLMRSCLIDGSAKFHEKATKIIVVDCLLRMLIVR